MENFNFYSPTFFAFGKDRELETGSLVKRFGGSKVLIHYGGGSVVRSGLLDLVKASLEKEELPYIVLGGVRPNPRSGLVSLGMPANFEELGAKEEDIPELVKMLCRGDGRDGMSSGVVTLDEEDCAEIYRMMV